PARLLHARDQPAAGQVAEADPADAELAVKRAGTPAEAASVPMLHREFPRRLRLDLLGLRGHARLEWSVVSGQWSEQDASFSTTNHAEQPRVPKHLPRSGQADVHSH